MRNPFMAMLRSAGAIAALSLIACTPCRADGNDTSPSPRERTAPDIESHVARAIASVYLKDQEALEEEYLFFKSLDSSLRAHGQPTTGLSDNVLDLTVCTITDRDAFIEAHQGLLETKQDKELRQRVSSRLTEDIDSANSLLMTDRYNRFTFLFNTFVRPLSLLAVGYFPALIDASVATLLHIDKFTELSVEEKKALVLYERFTAKYPDSDQAELLRNRITGLNKKRLAKSCQSEIALAEEMLLKDRYWQAQQHYKNALAYCPHEQKAVEGLEQAKRLELDKNRLRMKTFEPAEINRNFSEDVGDKDYQEILYAAASGSPEMMIYEAEDYLSRYPEGRHAPHAHYAVAVAHDMKGAHEKAKLLLKEVAAKWPDTYIGRHADAYLADTEYNLLQTFELSQRSRGAKTTKYIVMGPEFAKSNVILGTSRFITQGLHALESLGLYHVVAMGARGVSTVLRNPVSDEDVIATGVRYLRRYPDSPEGADIHLVLARAYIKRGDLSKAVYHFEASDKVSELKLAKLREKAANQYLDFARATENRNEKIRCYETILDRYPLTKAAVTGLEQLALLERAREPLFELDKKTLFENPILFKLTDLYIGPHLLDGDHENGEVAPRGIYSAQRGKITIVYYEDKKEREETVDIDYPTYRSLLAFAEEDEYQKKLAQRREGARGGRFPIELRGSVSDDGVFVYPRLKAKPYKDKDLYLYQ